jgi:uncharacterized membrane protein YedE/YeeE
LFGNPLSLLVAAGGAIYFAYQWWTGRTSLTVVVIAVLAAGYAMGAGERLQKYHEWKREWEAMEGKAPGHRYRWLRTPMRGLHIVLGLGAWAGTAYFLLTHADQPRMALPAGLFGIATLVMIFAAVYRLVQRWRARPKPYREVPVTLCVRLPRRSPTVAEALDALPEHCFRIFHKPPE